VRESAPLADGTGVLVCLPTYNEASNIVEVLERARAALPRATVLVLDDNSPDETAALAEAAGGRLGGVFVLRRPGKAGLGAAYRAGFAWGMERGYTALVEMDSDLSHDPAALPELLRTLDASADLAIGSRYVAGGAVRNWSAGRAALSRWGCRYSAFVLGLPVRDLTAGYRAYRRSALEAAGALDTRAEGYGFQIEMTYRLWRTGGRIVEVPITFSERARGTSKMSRRIAIEALTLVTWWGLRDRVLRRRRRPDRSA